MAAPDFAYGVGFGESHSLRDFRGERVVLLVLFSLPGSLDRLGELGTVYPAVRAAGGEILAVPSGREPDLYRRLGPRLLLFPFVVDGDAEAAEAYDALLRPVFVRRPASVAGASRHAELLVDRQGYLRARWDLGEPEGWRDPTRLLEAVRGLVSETPGAPLAEEHVH